MQTTQQEMQRINAYIPKSLIKNVKNITGLGITEIIKKSFSEIVQKDACEQLRSLRGKLKLDIDLKELREDKDRGRFWNKK
ncbi:MAG: hypothetical protein ACTSXL_01940 [Alphaproteobacteria bacterium]